MEWHVIAEANRIRAEKAEQALQAESEKRITLERRLAEAQELLEARGPWDDVVTEWMRDLWQASK
jgi:hypothetical protein